MTDDVEEAGRLAGEPDGFERLWTPHRMVYLLGDNKPEDGDAGPQCPFCRAPGLSDEDGLIVGRGEQILIVPPNGRPKRARVGSRPPGCRPLRSIDSPRRRARQCAQRAVPSVGY